MPAAARHGARSRQAAVAADRQQIGSRQLAGNTRLRGQAGRQAGRRS